MKNKFLRHKNIEILYKKQRKATKLNLIALGVLCLFSFVMNAQNYKEIDSLVELKQYESVIPILDKAKGSVLNLNAENQATKFIYYKISLRISSLIGLIAEA